MQFLFFFSNFLIGYDIMILLLLPGVDFKMKTTEIQGKTIKMQIWLVLKFVLIPFVYVENLLRVLVLNYSIMLLQVHDILTYTVLYTF